MHTYSELRRNLIFGVVTFLIAIFFAFATVFTINIEGETGVTGRTFPWIITGLLFVLSISLIVGTLCDLRALPKGERRIEPMLTREESRRIAAFVAGLVLYILCFIYIGFIVSTAAFLIFMLILMKAKNRCVAAAIVIITPCLLWYLFTVLMEVTFPEALLI